MEWIKAFFTNEDNINEIALWAFLGFLTLILVFAKRIFKGLGKLFSIGGKKTVSTISTKVKKIKGNRKYKRTIKQIERKEIPIPDNFLLGKSPEKNPELKRTFQMMDDGLIEVPSSYKLQKFIKDHPELKDIKPDMDKLYAKLPVIEIKPPTFKK